MDVIEATATVYTAPDPYNFESVKVTAKLGLLRLYFDLDGILRDFESKSIMREQAKQDFTAACREVGLNQPIYWS